MILSLGGFVVTWKKVFSKSHQSNYRPVSALNSSQEILVSLLSKFILRIWRKWKISYGAESIRNYLFDVHINLVELGESILAMTSTAWFAASKRRGIPEIVRPTALRDALRNSWAISGTTCDTNQTHPLPFSSSGTKLCVSESRRTFFHLSPPSLYKGPTKFSRLAREVKTDYPPRFRSSVYKLPVHQKLCLVSDGWYYPEPGEKVETPILIFAKGTSCKQLDALTEKEV